MSRCWSWYGFQRDGYQNISLVTDGCRDVRYFSVICCTCLRLCASYDAKISPIMYIFLNIFIFRLPFLKVFEWCPIAGSKTPSQTQMVSIPIPKTRYYCSSLRIIAGPSFGMSPTLKKKSKNFQKKIYSKKF